MKKESKLVLLTIAASFSMSVIQITFGYLANFKAVIAEGLYTFSYLISNFIAYVGDKLSRKPANARHPFGYGMVQYLTAIFMGFVIIIVGLLLGLNIFKISIYKPNPNIAIVIFGIMVLKLAITNYLKKHILDDTNRIIEGLLREYKSDAASSIAILTVILFDYIFKLNNILLPVDRIITIIIVSFVIKTGIELIIENSSDIIGEKDEDNSRVTEIRKLFKQEEEIVEIKQISIVKYGPYSKLDAVVKMNGKLTIQFTNDLIVKLKREIKKHDKKIKYINILVLPS